MMLELYNEGIKEFELSSTELVSVNSYHSGLSLPATGDLAFSYAFYFNY